MRTLRDVGRRCGAGALVIALVIAGVGSTVAAQVDQWSFDLASEAEATLGPQEFFEFDNFDPSQPPGIDISGIVPEAVGVLTVTPDEALRPLDAALALFLDTDDDDAAVLGAIVEHRIDDIGPLALDYGTNESSEGTYDEVLELLDAAIASLEAAEMSGVDVFGTDAGTSFDALDADGRTAALAGARERIGFGPAQERGWISDSLFLPLTGGFSSCDNVDVLCGTLRDPDAFTEGYHTFKFTLPEPPDTMPAPYEVEIVVTLLNGDTDPFVNAQFPGDLFNGANTAIVYQWNGEQATLREQRWDGAGWPEVDTLAQVRVMDNMVFISTPKENFTGVRLGAFMAGGARQPGSVGSATFPSILDDVVAIDDIGAAYRSPDLFVPANVDPAYFDRFVVVDDEAAELVEELPEPVETSVPPPETPLETPSTTESVGRDAPTSGDDESDGGFAWWWFPIAGGAGLIGTGLWLARRSDSNDITDALVTNVPAEFTRGAPPPRPDTAHLFLAATKVEDELQGKLRDAVAAMTKDLEEQRSAYDAAVDVFAVRFNEVASASTAMQGRLATWREERKIYQNADLAFSIITLVWGVGSLGFKLVNWLRTPKAAVEAAEVAARGSDDAAAALAAAAGTDDAAAAAAAADAILTEGATVADVGRKAANAGDTVGDGSSAVREVMELDAKYAAEIGVDIEAHAARVGWPTAIDDLLQATANARGWITISNDAIRTLNRLLVNGRSGAFGRGPGIDPSDLAKLRQWVDEVPDFWNRLLRSADMIADEGIMLLYNADDVRWLRALLTNEGPLSNLANLVTQTRGAAIAATADNAAAVGTAAATGSGVIGDVASAGREVVSISEDAGRRTTEQIARDAGTGRVHNALGLGGEVHTTGGLGSYVDQFGVTGRFDEGWGATIRGEAWDVLTSPFETYGRYTNTWDALTEFNELLEGHGDDLADMSTAAHAAVTALETMSAELAGATADHSSNPLSDTKLGELEDLLAEYEKTWTDEDEYDERRDHITKKLEHIRAARAALRKLSEQAQQLADWIESVLKNPDGSMKEVVDIFNPEILIRLESSKVAVAAGIAPLLGGVDGTGPTTAGGDTTPVPGLFDSLSRTNPGASE